MSFPFEQNFEYQFREQQADDSPEQPALGGPAAPWAGTTPANGYSAAPTAFRAQWQQPHVLRTVPAAFSTNLPNPMLAPAPWPGRLSASPVVLHAVAFTPWVGGPSAMTPSVVPMIQAEAAIPIAPGPCHQFRPAAGQLFHSNSQPERRGWLAATRPVSPPSLSPAPQLLPANPPALVVTAAAHPPRPRVASRSRRWTEGHVAQLRAGLRAGLKNGEIASQLGRTEAAAESKIRDLGLGNARRILKKHRDEGLLRDQGSGEAKEGDGDGGRCGGGGGPAAGGAGVGGLVGRDAGRRKKNF